MKPRFDFATASPNAFEAMLGLGAYLADSEPYASLRHLVDLRTSQINGCAYCIDMHWKDARADGESEQRLYALDAWRNAPFYSERERAALAWTEAVTLVADGHVPDDVYQAARAQFDERELVDLTLAVAATNAWNRLCIAFRSQPNGRRQAAAHAHRILEAA